MSTDSACLLPTSSVGRAPKPKFWETLRFTFKIKASCDIIPTSSHQSNPQIFHNDKKFQDLVMDKMTTTNSLKLKSVACDSYSDAWKQAVERFAGNGGINAAVGNIMCSSVFAESISSSNSVETSVSMMNVVRETFTINLPDEYPDIEDYLVPDFKRSLDDITTKEAAEKLVEKMGGGLYISKATFGGMLKRTKTAEAQEEHHNTNKSSTKDTQLKIPANLDAKGSAGFSYENNQAQADFFGSIYNTSTHTSVGGIPNLPTFFEWLKSIEGREEIVDFELSSISQLLPLVPRKSKKSENDDDEDNDAECLSKQTQKKEWLDDSISEYAKVQYEKKLHTDLKHARKSIVRKLELISDEFIIPEIHKGACTEKNAENIILQPLRKLKSDIEGNQMMSGKDIEKVLAKIDKDIEPKRTQRRWSNEDQKHQFWILAHEKIKDVKVQCSKLFSVSDE